MSRTFYASLSVLVVVTAFIITAIKSERQFFYQTPTESVTAWATLPANFSNPSNFDPNCPAWTYDGDLLACMWEKYDTDAWLKKSIQDILAQQKVTKTTELPHPWPYYLAQKYSDRVWTCYWDGKCDVEPPKPANDSDIDKVNGYFVLQAVDTFSTSMIVYRNVLQISRDKFANSDDPVRGLNGVVSQFSQDVGHLPGYSFISGEATLKLIAFMLSLIPYVNTATKPITFAMGFVEWPKQPADDSLKNIQHNFLAMCDAYEEQLRNSFLTFQNDYTYAAPLLGNGPYLPPPTKDVTDVWNNPGDWTSNRMINYQHWAIMQTFKAYGIYLHVEECNCGSDSKWTDQNNPSQMCLISPVFNDRSLYIFPVSWDKGEGTTRDKRKYDKFANIEKYAMDLRGIYERAVSIQIPGHANDWSNVPFPENHADQYKVPPNNVFTEPRLADVPGFWSLPICFSSNHAVNQCVGSNRCCTGFNYGPSPLNKGACKKGENDCKDWLAHYNHDNMGFDAWCAGKIGFDQGTGWYMAELKVDWVAAPRNWKDQC